MPQGLFIVPEGGDYAGKTTVVNYLKRVHPEFVYNREPGGVGFSQLVRELVLSDSAKDADVLTKFHLFWASRAENVAKIIRPALEAGKVVISDRFDASTYAYQIGENPELESLFWESRKACLQGITPIYLDFDVSPEVAQERSKGRLESNHFDRWSEEARRRTRSFYERFFEKVDCVRINADLPERQLATFVDGVIKALIEIES